MQKTKIEWCTHSWNVITGCTKISTGCKNCYAEKMTKRLQAIGQEKYKDGFDKIVFHQKYLNEPDNWKKSSMIFVNSMSDTFHENIPEIFIEQIWDVMKRNPQHTFQVLTKRAMRMKKVVEKLDLLPNVWLGVTVENQDVSKERIRNLLKTPVAIRFISIEPILTPIFLETNFLYISSGDPVPCIDWVIIGGESGIRARSSKYFWYRQIITQCKNVDIPVFIKQLNINGYVNKKFDTFPLSLKIRQYPEK